MQRSLTEMSKKQALKESKPSKAIRVLVKKNFTSAELLYSTLTGKVSKEERKGKMRQLDPVRVADITGWCIVPY